jgi:hypothetical protein
LIREREEFAGERARHFKRYFGGRQKVDYLIVDAFFSDSAAKLYA